MSGYVRSIGSIPFERAGIPVVSALLALAIGLFVTLAASLEPARRAGSISPVEALKARLDPAAAKRARLRWLVGVFVAVGVAGLLVWPRDAGIAGLIRAGAVYTLLLAVVLASPFVLGALARLAGLPFARVIPAGGAAGAGRPRPGPEPDGAHGRRADGEPRDDRRDRRGRGAVAGGGERLAGRGDPGRRARHIDPPDRPGRGIRDRRTSSRPSTASSGSARSPRSKSRHDGVRTDAAAVVGTDLLEDGRLRILFGDRAVALDGARRGRTDDPAARRSPSA